MKKIFFSTILSSIFIANQAMALSLNGEFKFSAKPPQVALIYFVESKNTNTNANTIDQLNKEFTKKVIVSSKNSEITFKNSDNIEHNIYGKLDGNVLFDIGLAPPGSVNKRKVDWNEGKVAKVGCKIHPKMNAWIASVNSKYYKVVEFNKMKEMSFNLGNVPDNLSKVRIWFPNYDAIDIDLKKGNSRDISIKNKNKDVGTLKLISR